MAGIICIVVALIIAYAMYRAIMNDDFGSIHQNINIKINFRKE